MKRYLTSAPIGIAVTLGLLFAMQALIESGNAVLTDPRPRHGLTIVRVKKEEVINKHDPRPERIPDPVTPPPMTTTDPADPSGGRTILVGRTPPALPPDPGGTGIFVLSDGPLVSIVRVAPMYPTDLSQRGIEGFVVVRFDVNAEGGVTNARVVESSHRGFERNALRAALKFRYKPRVVDGVPVATHNVGYRFRFNMDD